MDGCFRGDVLDKNEEERMKSRKESENWTKKKLSRIVCKAKTKTKNNFFRNYFLQWTLRVPNIFSRMMDWMIAVLWFWIGLKQDLWRDIVRAK